VYIYLRRNYVFLIVKTLKPIKNLDNKLKINNVMRLQLYTISRPIIYKLLILNYNNEPLYFIKTPRLIKTEKNLKNNNNNINDGRIILLKINWDILFL